MKIRHTTPDDIPAVMAVYEKARAYMRESGNPSQWGPRQYPEETLIRGDIERGTSYVCVLDGRVVGTFCFLEGEDEPTYAVIREGAWLSGAPYGVIHRLASDGTVKGVASEVFAWALKRWPHMRVDTHRDNAPMQHIFKKMGFEYCGLINVEDGTERLAFEKTGPDLRAIKENRNTKNAFALLSGIEITEILTGEAKVRMTVTADHLNPVGSVHGGCLYTIADVAAGSAASSYGGAVTTMEGSLHFLRPGLNCKELIGRAEVIKRGRRAMVITVSVRDQDERELAHGIFTYMPI